MPGIKTLARQKSPEAINKLIIDNLGGSVAAHLRDKHLYHEQGLPFYTCVGDKEWTKEMPDGKLYLVTRQLDKQTFEIKEKLVRKIK
jgi:hypothetical protein